MWDKEYRAVCKRDVNEDVHRSARFIFERNILCGNALSLKTVDAGGHDLGAPIIFSEWTFVTGDLLQRRDFRLDVLLLENPDKDNYSTQISLFAEEPTGMNNWMTDPVTQQQVPKPVREYPLTDYRRIWQHGD